MMSTPLTLGIVFALAWVTGVVCALEAAHNRFFAVCSLLIMLAIVTSMAVALGEGVSILLGVR